VDPLGYGARFFQFIGQKLWLNGPQSFILNIRDACPFHGDTDPVAFVIGAQALMRAGLYDSTPIPGRSEGSEQGPQINHLRAPITRPYPQWGIYGSAQLI